MHDLDWIEKHGSAVTLFSKVGEIWAVGSIEYFVKCSFRPERFPYKTYTVRVEEEKEREGLLEQLSTRKGINVNLLA